jgi:hypothetical protein
MDAESKSTRQEQIRDVFARELRGWGSIRRLAEIVIERGLYEDDELEQAAVRAVMRDCKSAMKVRGDEGMPFAMPSAETDSDDESGAPIWKQPRLFDLADFEVYIANESKSLMSDYVSLTKVRDYCLARFGTAPAIPEIEAFTHA